MVTIPELNVFSRKYDMVFIEMGRHQHNETYWFLDYKNKRTFFTAEEIRAKIDLPLVQQKA